MKYAMKVGILQASIFSATAAIALSTTTDAWAANLVFVNNRADVGADDFINWASPLSVAPRPNPLVNPTQFTISSNRGLTVTGNQNGAPGAVRIQNPTASIVGVNSPYNANATQNSTFWNGNFAPNDAVYWNQGNGPLSLSFATPVSAVGTQLDSLFYKDSNDSDPNNPDRTQNLPTQTSPFRGTITAFLVDGSSETFSATGLTNALANNTAAFFGVKSASANITRIEFDTFDIPSGSRYFNYAINGVSIATAATAVPEPFTIVGTLLGAGSALKMRKRFKANNKL
jgi:hypothetical protein